MSRQLVNQLRKEALAESPVSLRSLCMQAADEIERLDFRLHEQRFNNEVDRWITDSSVKDKWQAVTDLETWENIAISLWREIGLTDDERDMLNAAYDRKFAQ